MFNLLLAQSSQGFLYRPEHGQIWDPSVLWSNGTYYQLSMYSPSGSGFHSSGWLATSKDGVHWSDVGPVAPAAVS